MNGKMKEFVGEHRAKIAILGTCLVGGICFGACYMIGYRDGKKVMVNHICERYGGHFMDVLRTAAVSKNLYSSVLTDRNGALKFKKFVDFAHDAVENSPSHLEDTITGVFVFTD